MKLSGESSPWLRILPTVALCLVPLGGCGGGGGDGGDKSPPGSIELADENNYTSVSDMELDIVDTAPEADLDICWSDIEDDLQCHGVTPKADIDNIAMLRFQNLSKDEAEQRLVSGELDMADIAGYVDYPTDHVSTCTTLSEMTFFGTPIELDKQYTESDEYLYILLFAHGTTPGVGARTMTFVNPTSSSSNTTVTAPSGCGLLDFTADLERIEPVEIPVDGPWVMDWRHVSEDSLGNEIAYESIDNVLLAFYEGMTLREVQDQIFDLEYIYTNLWEIPLDGERTTDLADARDRDTGDRFSGFENDDGVWLMALMCSQCQNPAPVILTILEPT